MEPRPWSEDSLYVLSHLKEALAARRAAGQEVTFGIHLGGADGDGPLDNSNKDNGA